MPSPCGISKILNMLYQCIFTSLFMVTSVTDLCSSFWLLDIVSHRQLSRVFLRPLYNHTHPVSAAGKRNIMSRKFIKNLTKMQLWWTSTDEKLSMQLQVSPKLTDGRRKVKSRRDGAASQANICLVYTASLVTSSTFFSVDALERFAQWQVMAGALG